MFNLIKKDIIATITSNKKFLLEYLFILLFMYTILNQISYSTANIILSYLILMNTFRCDNENNSGDFILSMPTNKEKVVYSKYVMSFVLIIITTIMNSIITTLLGGIFYRGPVLNDVLMSNIVFLIIVSIVLPIILKFGYQKSKFYVVGISLIFASFVFTILNIVSMLVWNNSHEETILGIISTGPSIGLLNDLFEYIIENLNTTYINLFTISFVSILIFLLSMYVSLRIVGNKKIVNKNTFIRISLSILVLFLVYIYGNKVSYGKMVYVEDYEKYNAMEVEMNVDGYREIKEGTLVKIKIINRSKFTYRIEDAKLEFGNELVFEDGSSTYVKYVTLNPYEGDLNNNRLIHEGIEPFGEGYITFLHPKGLKLDGDFFDLNNVEVNIEEQFTVNIPLLNSFTTVGRSAISYAIDYMNIDSNK